MKKRTLAAVALWTLLGIVGVGSARAQDDHGNSRETATIINLGPVIRSYHGIETRDFIGTNAVGWIEANLEREGDIDYFRFTVQEPASVVISKVRGYGGSGIDPSIRIILEDSHGHALNNHAYIVDCCIEYAAGGNITAGTYYVMVSGRDRPDLRRRGAPVETTGPYIIDASFYFPGNDDHSDIVHPDTATRVRVNSQVRGTILPSNDKDNFRVDIDRPGILSVYTTGETDTTGGLNGWDPHGAVSGWDRFDDDGRDGHNFQIVWPVSPGTHYVTVEGKVWEQTGERRETYTGPYTLHVEFAADGDPPPDPSSMRGALRATLLNLSPWQAWVHLYCQKDQIPRADLTTDPCAVTLECGQMAGTPVTWTVDVEPKSVFSYKSGTEANLEAALVAAGKTDAEARRRTTCEVFSPDPLEARAYTRIAGELVPVADQPILLDQAAPQRIATLIDLSPPQSWVHLYCRKDRPAPDAAPANPCAVNLECRREEGDPVSWTVDVAPKTIFSYWPGKTAPDGTSDNLQAALIATGKTEEEARRRTTCEVSSPDPIAVRGYTRLGEGIIPVKN